MREIANLSSRTAIATHSFRRRAFHTWRMLGIAISVAVAGALLLYLAHDRHSPLIYLGAAAVLGALCALGSAAYLARKTQLLKEAHGGELAATPSATSNEPNRSDNQEPAEADER
jgi:drug/metabolite transporter (DMT)-like permease